MRIIGFALLALHMSPFVAAEPIGQSCTDLLNAKCPLNATRCGVCVTKNWPSLRNKPACFGVGHGELYKHCDGTPDFSRDTNDEDDDWLCSDSCVGIMKSTWAASDPVNTTLPALLKYLPVESTPDSCPNQICACGSCGRTQMLGDTHFGLHTVAAKGLNDCRATPPLTGDLTVADVESIFDEELGDMSTYTPFMDYNAMMWTPTGTLDSYREAFDADGVPTLKLKWPCFDDDSTTMCYSILWHIPKSMVNVEIASNETATPNDFIEEQFPRHWFRTHDLPSNDYMEPLHDSRAVDNIDDVIAWWDSVLDMSPAAVRYGADSSVTVTFAFASTEVMGHDANVQYVYRPKLFSAPFTNGTTTISYLQSYWNQVAEKYMTNMTSMWPIWGDNHLALADHLEGKSIDAVIGRLDAMGNSLYHPFVGMENGEDGFGHTALYIQDPSGFQVEYHSAFLNPDESIDVDVGDFNEYCDYHCGLEAAKTQETAIVNRLSIIK